MKLPARSLAAAVLARDPGIASPVFIVVGGRDARPGELPGAVHAAAREETEEAAR